MSAPAELRPVAIDVVSDVICPWCYLGKQRLEKGITLAGRPVVVRWRPYQLDPSIPPEGMHRRAYLQSKFGPGDGIARAHERLTALGAEEGVGFAFDRINVTPNTLDAHRLSRWASAEGKQDATVTALFHAYFTEGRDIGDVGVLAELASEIGVDGPDVAQRLASHEDRAEVQSEAIHARRIGITGVPTFILANRYGLVGAQPPEEIARVIVDVSEKRNAPEGDAA